jgi:phosphohistidine phosphatase
MLLYLVRHAIAGEHDPVRWPDDRERPLTPEGEKKFRQAALGLRALVPSVDVILSSPLVRAWQTALILHTTNVAWPEPQRLDALGLAIAPADVVDALLPHASAKSIALVGHEPSMHELASYLLTGDASAVRMILRKGAVACLRCADAPRPASADLEWVLQPRTLRRLAT